MDEVALRKSFDEDRLQQLLKEKKQPQRYQLLANDVLNEVQNHPVETMSRRIKALEIFTIGEYWDRKGQLSVVQDRSNTIVEPPEWLSDNLEVILHGTFRRLCVVALGWRWATHGAGRADRRQHSVDSVPYLLVTRSRCWSPRMPLDGVLPVSRPMLIGVSCRFVAPVEEPARAPMHHADAALFLPPVRMVPRSCLAGIDAGATRGWPVARVDEGALLLLDGAPAKRCRFRSVSGLWRRTTSAACGSFTSRRSCAQQRHLSHRKPLSA